MAQFEFLAVNNKKASISSTIEANDRLSAINMLKSKGLRVVTIKEKSSKSGGFSFGKKSKGVKAEELVVFTRQLSTMVSAGVPILRALNSMSQHAQSAGFRTTINSVIKDIEGGTSFADALSKHPNSFNDVYVNMVRAGETGGILDDILKRLALQQEKNDSIKKKVKSAMTYPMVLIVITVGAFFGLMIFVIPAIGKTHTFFITRKFYFELQFFQFNRFCNCHLNKRKNNVSCRCITVPIRIGYLPFCRYVICSFFMK